MARRLRVVLGCVLVLGLVAWAPLPAAAADGLAPAPGTSGAAVSSSAVKAASVTGNAAGIAVGASHSCALLAGGTAACWGDDEFGQLGDGTGGNQRLPLRHAAGGERADHGNVNHGWRVPLVRAPLGRQHRLLGQQHLWRARQRDDDQSSVPVAVSGITTATAIASGDEHTCALLSGGSVKCWGYNFYGELGNGTTTDSSTPVAVSGITTATAIAAGGAHTCALLAGGSVDCWGETPSANSATGRRRTARPRWR